MTYDYFSNRLGLKQEGNLKGTKEWNSRIYQQDIKYLTKIKLWAVMLLLSSLQTIIYLTQNVKAINNFAITPNLIFFLLKFCSSLS